METLPTLTDSWREILGWFEVVSVIVFSVEYLVRLLCGRPKFRYAFSFFGIIDLLAILPFYVAVGIDLRVMRSFRLLRLFRVLKLARYNSAMLRFYRAFKIAREELVLFGAAGAIVLYLASVGIYYFENEAQPAVFHSVFHSMWWAVSTLTTVGYGDAVPVTSGGKAFTFFTPILGLGIVAVPTGLFAPALSQAREIENSDEIDEE